MPDIGTQISVKIPNMYHTFEIQILIQYISKIIVIKKNNFQLSNPKKNAVLKIWPAHRIWRIYKEVVLGGVLKNMVLRSPKNQTEKWIEIIFMIYD